MAEYDDTNKGALFKKDGVKAEDWHDDYSGSINVDGSEYWIGAAIRESKNGQKYMKLNVRPKESKAPQIREQLAKPAPSDDFDDSIPF